MRVDRQGWGKSIRRYWTAANGWRERAQGRSGKESVCHAQPGYLGFSRYLVSGLRGLLEHLSAQDLIFGCTPLQANDAMGNHI